jgi:4-diphosphocytidyl-2-C-methyl-D-erythritol kinase
MIALRAPAKINLCLRVLGRRPDGYHELESVFQMVGLYDEVVLRPRRRGISVDVEGVDLPHGSGNLAYDAAVALAREAGGVRGVSIHLAKQIPLGAGLGGGSSDAAAVLIGLNRLWRLRWPRPRLAALGAALGSDVPFFFFGPTAWVTGRGEHVAPAPSLRPSTSGPWPCWAVLVNPGFPVSTQWAFQALDQAVGGTIRKTIRLTNGGSIYRMGRLSVASPASVRSMANDLERVSVARYPVIEEIKAQLLKAGAVAARMSGSGPTVFGLFATRAEAAKASEGLSPSWRRWVVRVLRRAPW